MDVVYRFIYNYKYCLNTEISGTWLAIRKELGTITTLSYSVLGHHSTTELTFYYQKIGLMAKPDNF